MTSQHDKAKRWQFGLGWLFALTTLAAVVIATTAVLPNYVMVPVTGFLLVAGPAVLTTVAIFRDGASRAFAIGALFPQLVALLTFTGNGVYNSLDAITDVVTEGQDYSFAWSTSGRVLLAASYIASVVVGLLCLAVWRMLERQEH